jgi:hypothetical protein
MTGQVRATWHGKAADRRQAQEIISGEYGPPVPEDADAGGGYDEPIPGMGRPLVAGRDHPSWPEIGAGQLGADR